MKLISGGFLLRGSERDIDEMLRQGLGAGGVSGLFEPFDLFGLKDSRKVETDQCFGGFGWA